MTESVTAVRTALAHLNEVVSAPPSSVDRPDVVFIGASTRLSIATAQLLLELEERVAALEQAH